MGLDQQTKQQLKDNFDQIKPQLQSLAPNMNETQLSQVKSDPDSFVRDVADDTGQSTDEVERQVKQYANA